MALSATAALADWQRIPHSALADKVKMRTSAVQSDLLPRRPSTRCFFHVMVRQLGETITAAAGGGRVSALCQHVLQHHGERTQRKPK
jgi:hypothetical protein